MLGTSPIIILGAQECGEGSSPPRMLSLPQLSIRLAPETYDNWRQHLTYGTCTDMSNLDPGTGYGKMGFGYSAQFQDMAGVVSFRSEQLKLGEFQQNWQNNHHSRSGKKSEEEETRRGSVLATGDRCCFSVLVAAASRHFSHLLLTTARCRCCFCLSLSLCVCFPSYLLLWVLHGLIGWKGTKGLKNPFCLPNRSLSLRFHWTTNSKH